MYINLLTFVENFVYYPPCVSYTISQEMAPQLQEVDQIGSTHSR